MQSIKGRAILKLRLITMQIQQEYNTQRSILIGRRKEDYFYTIFLSNKGSFL